MTLKEFIQSLQDFVDKNPETLDLEVVVFEDRDMCEHRHYSNFGDVEISYVEYIKSAQICEEVVKDEANAVYLYFNC